MLAGLMQDFRYAFRVLLKKPAFTLVAVLTLGLGIGAATGMFSAVERIFAPTFFKDEDRMVAVVIHNTTDTHPGNGAFFPGPEFLDYVEQNHVFADVVGGTMEDVLLTTPEGTEDYRGALVTANTWDFFGMPAVVGREPTADDVKPGATPVFAMAYTTWVKHFGQDPSIVGKTFILNGVPTTLVGIMPPRFTKLDSDMLFPVAISRTDPQMAKQFFGFQAKLKPGITRDQAAADLTGIALREAKIYPRYYPKKFTVQVVPLVLGFLAQFGVTMYMFSVAVALLLLIACSNVANMLLAQASAREKEMAIRSALGASRWRIVRQLLIESLLLALGGAAAGLVVAYWGLKGFHAAAPAHLNLADTTFPINLTVLLFALGVAACTAILFGLVPALQTAKRDIVEPLKDSGHGVSGGFRRGKFRSALVVVEVALSIVLLAGAGASMHAFVKMTDANLGFDPHNILLAGAAVPKGSYTTAAAQQQFFSQLLERVEALPGVVGATETTSVPPFGGMTSPIDIPGKVHSDEWSAHFTLCSEGYYQTLGMRLLKGRFLSQVEVNDARKVAVVNQTLATKYFGQQDPLGQMIKITQMASMTNAPVADPTFEIIGVTADTKNAGIVDPPVPEVFVPYTVMPFGEALLVRTTRDPALYVDSVRREVWAVDRGVALSDPESLEYYLERYEYADPRFALTMLAIFSGLGLALVAVGVYSVTAYTVSRQTHEIGIRMALGAGRADVLRMVMWMGLRLVALGVAVGLLASWWTMRVVANQFSNMTTHDPLTLVGVAAVLIVVGGAACYLPARRATRVDPMVALRYE
jgi:putative ABC transport system permease protein